MTKTQETKTQETVTFACERDDTAAEITALLERRGYTVRREPRIESCEIGEEDDERALWHVRHDDDPKFGGTIEIVAGYNEDDRPLIALEWAGADLERWSDGRYDQNLWVRRHDPNDEEGPGQLFRVLVQPIGDAQAEKTRRAWTAKRKGSA